MKKLRVGILGLGRGRSHLGNFTRVEDAEVIGCAERVERLRTRAQEFAPDVPMVEEFGERLAMEPDAIAVATNGRLQAQHTIEALNAGCHVISEVPGCFTVEEAQELGLPVNTGMPELVYKLMTLYRQSGQRRPSVQYIPVPYRPTEEKGKK